MTSSCMKAAQPNNAYREWIAAVRMMAEWQKGWKQMCCSLSDNLCSAIANLTRRLCFTNVDPEGISALVACRLVALDKNPGIRPIGIGETLRRLIGKAILCIVQRTAGSLQGPAVFQRDLEALE